MSSFIGYEPKNVPISLEPAATQRSSPSSIRAGGNPIAAHQGNSAEATLPIQAGSASDPAQATLVQADPPDTLASDLGSMMETSMISVEDFLAEPIVPVQSTGQPSASTVTNVPSSAWGNPMPNEVQHLKQEVDSLRSQLHETKITAENYAEQVKTRSHLKAEEALHYQKDTFEKRAEEYSFTARDICQRSHTPTLFWKPTRFQLFMRKTLNYQTHLT